MTHNPYESFFLVHSKHRLLVSLHALWGHFQRALIPFVRISLHGLNNFSKTPPHNIIILDKIQYMHLGEICVWQIARLLSVRCKHSGLKILSCSHCPDNPDSDASTDCCWCAKAEPRRQESPLRGLEVPCSTFQEMEGWLGGARPPCCPCGKLFTGFFLTVTRWSRGQKDRKEQGNSLWRLNRCRKVGREEDGPKTRHNFMTDWLRWTEERSPGFWDSFGNPECQESTGREEGTH